MSRYACASSLPACKSTVVRQQANCLLQTATSAPPPFAAHDAPCTSTAPPQCTMHHMPHVPLPHVPQYCHCHSHTATLPPPPLHHHTPPLHHTAPHCTTLHHTHTTATVAKQAHNRCAAQLARLGGAHPGLPPSLARRTVHQHTSLHSTTLTYVPCCYRHSLRFVHCFAERCGTRQVWHLLRRGVRGVAVPWHRRWRQ